MKKILEICTLIALLVWGGVFIYFYATGRIERHLDPSFRIYALIAGIGFATVALFNFLTFKRSAGVCNHEHAHGDECDHDHGQQEGHHDHKHDEDCDHKHDSGHEHHHEDAAEEAEHHEHNHDETSSGLAFALLILIAPILMAAHYSKDSFSMGYLDKWGKIESQMQQMRIAEKSKTNAATVAATDPKANNPYANPVSDPANPEGTTAPDGTVGNGSDKTGTPEGAEDNSTEAGDEWGEFTLEDLKKMVPQSSDGDFLLDVPQIFYTAGDRELMDVMEGISVETTAQLMEEAQSEEGAPKKLKAFRLFIECCAADARPLSVPVEFPDGMPDYKEMGWYKMIGELHYSTANDEIVPTLKIKTLESTTEPVEGLLY